MKCELTAEVIDKELDSGKEVTDCPKCKGAFVDTWRINKYLPVNKINNEDENKPILVIELEKENSVPKVFYKGKEILMKQNILFDWETRTEVEGSGGLSYAIQHQEVDSGYPCNNRIERKIDGHAID